jgi:hypothetical protein
MITRIIPKNSAIAPPQCMNVATDMITKPKMSNPNTIKNFRLDIAFANMFSR